MRPITLDELNQLVKSIDGHILEHNSLARKTLLPMLSFKVYTEDRKPVADFELHPDGYHPVEITRPEIYSKYISE